MYTICNETVQLQTVVLFKMSFFFLLWHQSSWFSISNEQQIKQKANGLTCDGGAGVLSSPLERSGLLPHSQACVVPDRPGAFDWWLLGHACQSLRITSLPRLQALSAGYFQFVLPSCQSWKDSVNPAGVIICPWLRFVDEFLCWLSSK